MCLAYTRSKYEQSHTPLTVPIILMETLQKLYVICVIYKDRRPPFMEPLNKNLMNENRI